MRRLISLVSIIVALLALAFVLYNATLVDRRAPTVARISLSAPAGDERLAQTLTAIDIEFTEPVRTSTVESRFRIEPYVAGAFAWDGSTAIFTPSAKLPGDTEFSISISGGFEDLIGNVNEVGLEPWVFRTVGPPVVVSSVPSDGASGIAVDATVDLVFDRLMDTALVETSIHIDPPIAVRAAWRGESVRLSFDSQLRFGTDYTLTVGATAADTSGNRLREPYVLHFSTVAAGLLVVGTVPAGGASGIGVRTPIAVQFDGPVDLASAQAAFRITPSVSGEVRVLAVPDDRLPPNGAGGPVPRADTIVFEPNDPLAPNTTYTVTIAPIVARQDDPEAVAAGQAWSFTTGSPTTSGQNQIAFLSARSGVRNVWLMNPDGTNPRQLTTELVPVSGFDATGDGSLVAYSAGGVVRLIGIDGEDLRILTEPDTYEYAPLFMPSDDSLIVGRRGSGGEDLGYWLVPVPGSEVEERQLVDRGAPALGSAELRGDGIGGTDGTPGWMPRSAVDPTGRTALIVTAGGEVFTFDLGEEPFPLGPVPVALVTDAAAAWSTRYEAFVITGVESGAGLSATPAMWTINSGGAIQKLPGTDGAVGPVGAGPGGALAVTVRATGSTAAGVGILAPPGATLSRLVPAVNFDDRWPWFSPDGGSVLVGRTFVVRPADGDGIWSIDLVSGSATQLSTDGAYARWLP